MRTRSLAFSLLALTASLATACSNGTGFVDASDVQQDIATVDAFDATNADANDAGTDTGVDARTDVSYDVQFADVTRDAASDVMISPTHEYVFVMNALNVDPDDNPANPHTGFDVDGRASDGSDAIGCNHSDFGSALDPDQNSPTGCLFNTAGCNGAVDNQFPTMADTIQSATGMDARALLNTSIDRHVLVLMLRLTRVDSFVDDSDVGVQVFRGFPTFSSDCTTVTAGREYQVDQASLRTGGTTVDDAVFSVTASIVRGRLQFAAPDSFVFTLSGTNLLPIGIHAMRMRGDVTPDGISNGNLGGWDTGDNLVTQLRMIAPPQYAPIIPGLVGGFVDVQLMGVCRTGGSTPRLGGVSLGAGFTAVPATLSTTMQVASAQMPGTCGAQ